MNLGKCRFLLTSFYCTVLRSDKRVNDDSAIVISFVTHVEGMGGTSSEFYQTFRKQCFTAFLHLRR